MRFFRTVVPALMILSSGAVTRADFDVVPYELAGKIVTGGEDDVTGAVNITERVYGFHFDEVASHPFIITDPGFNNGTSFTVGVFPNNGLLPVSKDLAFTVLTNLEYWDGTGAVSFGAAPASVSLGLNHDLLIDAASHVPDTSTIGNTAAAGRLHVHIESDLNYTDGTDKNPPNAPDGLYLIGMKLSLPGSGIADSEPIFLIYNNNTDDAIQDDAIAWANANLVPEPATWLLLATSLGALAARRWRKCRRMPD
jgi:hypothetical protein